MRDENDFGMRLSSFLAVIFSQNLIGVTSEDYLGTPLGDDRNIFNKDGNRVREVHKNLIGPDPVTIVFIFSAFGL